MPPAGVGAILIFMMLAPEYPGIARSVAVALAIVMVLDFLVMFFNRKILKVPGLMLVLRVLGAVLIFMQAALAADTMLDALRHMGVFRAWSIPKVDFRMGHSAPSFQLSAQCRAKGSPARGGRGTGCGGFGRRQRGQKPDANCASSTSPSRAARSRASRAGARSAAASNSLSTAVLIGKSSAPSRVAFTLTGMSPLYPVPEGRGCCYG